MKQYRRSERVRSQMLRDVQTLLEHEFAANLNTMVTFTDVKVSEDLRYATIYYSVLGGDKAKKEVSEYLSRARSRIRSQIGRLLSIRHTPEIKFKFDPTIEKGIRIQKLLDDISRSDGDEDRSNI
ncbi:MAG: 30S ribosome-binding factor RbfA [Candidatus Zixiibacteriota bacterium]|nr:MAG: 30S ribosome-binding factor RbfA [candidate division Zixibacteria bacterium]